MHNATQGAGCAWKRAIWGGASAVALLSSANPGFAAEPTGNAPASLVDEIVVTANRREEKLQDVGIAATAFSRDQISALGFTNATDITRQTPAVSFYQFHPTLANINIRGVVQNDFADHLEPPIAVYQDDAYIGSPGGISVPIFDLERVEVLRGPQGTLFGRNSTGGLIHYVSARPSHDIEGYAQASYGNFNTLNAEAAVGGPINDRVRARLSLAYNYSDGPYHNLVGKDPGNTNNWAARVQVEADLSERTSLLLIGKAYGNFDERGPGYSFNVATVGPDGLGVQLPPNQIGQWPNILLGGVVTGACPGCNVNGDKAPSSNPFVVTNSFNGAFDRKIFGAQGRITHDLGNGVVLTSISDFLHISKRLDFDSEPGAAQFFINRLRQPDYDQVSQELRLNGTTDRLKWVAGVYYLHMKGHYGAAPDFDFSSYLGLPVCRGSTCPPGTFQTYTDYHLKTRSYAVFAQGEYEITPQLSATLGARYTKDDKRFDYVFEGPDLGIPQLIYSPATNGDANRSFKNVSLKAQLDWRPTDGTLIYASYTRGHKGGNWAAPLFPPLIVPNFPHKQEVLTSYEVGAKMRLMEGRATFNVSAYYYDYKDFQAFSIVNLAPSIFNVPATAYGGEAEFRVRPMENLELLLAGATESSKVKDVVLPDLSVVNRDLPNAPTLQLNGIIRYGWDLPEGRLTAQAAGKYTGRQHLTVLNEPVTTEPKSATLDVRLSYLTAGKVELAAFVKNVTDTKYRVYALDIAPISLALDVFALPRQYGVSARYAF